MVQITLSHFFKSHSIYEKTSLSEVLTKESFAIALLDWERERLARRHQATVALSEVFAGNREFASLEFNVVCNIANRIFHALAPGNVDPADLTYSLALIQSLVEENIKFGEFVEVPGATKRQRMISANHEIE